MKAQRRIKDAVWRIAVMAVFGLVAAGCGGRSEQATATGEVSGAAVESRFAAPADLQPAALGAGERLRVVATTSLIADAVQRVAGERADVSVLIAPGVDPHSYVAAPRDLVALEEAHAIFANGLGLEESLLPAILEASGGAPLLEVNAGVEPIALAGDEQDDEGAGDHAHGGLDPHTWQDVASVQLWVTNIRDALAALDPANAAAYKQAAAGYLGELEELDAEVRETLAPIPTERRKLVTDHDTFRYFARAYGFTVVGAVIPSFSTLATLSAQERAALQDQIAAEGVQAIFVGNTAANGVAEQLAADAGVQVARLATDSLTAADGPAPTYVEMMRANARAIAAALTP